MRIQIYEWLRGDRVNSHFTQYFQCNYFTFRYKSKGGVGDHLLRNDGSELWINSHSPYKFRLYPQDDYANTTNTEVTISTITYDNGILDINGEKKNVVITRMRPEFSSGMFGEIITDTIHLKPCKLLAPYGTHPIGECAMIDVLSNTLYFNEGTGAFSVEGECLYEFETPVIKQVMRKPNVVVRLREWLRNIGGAYINSGIRPTSTLVEYSGRFKVNKLGDRTCILSGFVEGQASRGVNLEIYSRIESYQGKWDKFRWNIYGSDIPTEEVSVGNIYDYKMSVKGKEAYLLVKENGNDFVSADKSVTPLDFYDNVLMFDDYRHNQFYKQNLSLGVTTINGTTFHPCEILYHPTLPPQSAMIDLSTGTIYTNQGTGIFTCEGADLGIWTDTLYDDMRIKDVKADMVCIKQNGEPRVVWERTQPFIEHKWLVGDGVANLDSIATHSVDLTISRSDSTDRYLFSLNKGDEWDSKVSELRVRGNIFVLYNWNNGYPKYIEVPISDKAHLYIEGTKCYVNDTECDLTTISSRWIRLDYLNFALNRTANRNAKGIHISAITTDTLHLTPSILNRPTLPTEDNNGIARKKGEAVFVDKERYKRGLPWVFGNVANSGSFSVSDE